MVGLDASMAMIEVAKNHAKLDKTVEEHVRWASVISVSCINMLYFY